MATYNSLNELEKLKDELARQGATYKHDDENSADTRLFVWDFKPDDVKEFVAIFEQYAVHPENAFAWQKMQSLIYRKCMAMLNEKCNPVECMLYSSKAINSHINARLLKMLAQNIKNVYTQRDNDTAEVIEHIFERWRSWTPQMRVTIAAVGLIGDNTRLLDDIYELRTESELRTYVFDALLQNKNETNLRRVLDIVIAFEDDDAELQQKFVATFGSGGYGSVGDEILNEYRNNPVLRLTPMGRRTLDKLTTSNGLEDQGKYLFELAKRSKNDDAAYDEFLRFCQSNRDANAAFRCRFSRREITDDFLVPLLESGDVSDETIAVTVISIARLTYLRRYRRPMKYDPLEIINRYGTPYVRLASKMVMSDRDAIKEFAATLAAQPERNLNELYNMLKNATITRAYDSVPLIQDALVKQLDTTFNGEDFIAMDNLASNLEVFKRNKIGELISDTCLRKISKILDRYVQSPQSIDENAVVALVNVIDQHYSKEFLEVLFKLYRQEASNKVRNKVNDVLKDKDIVPPGLN